MDVGKRRNALHDQASSCQSFSNNHLPSGQIRKISIGITVGASPGERPSVRKENELVLPANEKNVFPQGKPAEGHDVALKASSKRKQAECPDQETSARICSPTFNEKAETVKIVQPLENQPVSESGGKKVEKAGDGEVVKEIAFTKMQERHAWDKEGFGGKLERPADTGREVLKMKLREILGESPKQKDQISNLQSRKTETNNLKSQKNGDQNAQNTKHYLNSDPIETDSESPSQTVRRPVTRSITRKKGLTRCQPKLKHSNDHILPSALSFNVKRNHQEKNIFSFDEAEAQAESLSCPSDGNGRLSKRKKNEKDIYGSKQDKSFNSRNDVSDYLKAALLEKMPEPRAEKTASKTKRTDLNSRPDVSDNLRTAFREKMLQPQPEKTASKGNIVDSNYRNAVSDNLKTAFREKIKQQQADKTASKIDRIKDVHSPSSQMNKYSLQPKNIFPDEELHNSQTTKKLAPKNLSSQSAKNDNHQKRLWTSPVPKCPSSCRYFDSPSPKNLKQEENFDTPLSLKTAQVDFQSPTFAMKMPTTDAFPSSPSSERIPRKEKPTSPLSPWRRFKVEGSNSTKQTLELVSDGSEADAESSDDALDFTSNARELSPSAKDKDITNWISHSLVEEQDNGNSGTEFNQKGFTATEKWPSGTVSPEESSLMLHYSRKFCNQDNTELSSFDCPSPSPKDTEDCQGAAEYQENGLARAIAQFTLVLERFKTMMKSQTGRKSSEILASVAERMHSQLQSIDSQIQMDVGKFTSLSKAKMKCLESRFQEEREKLKLIHDKFKNEVNQHLQHCRSTVEELEAHRIELKGNAERQKALQRKLLLETEEAIRMQLSDAERSIMAIHKASRGKMKELKRALMECLSEFT